MKYDSALLAAPVPCSDIASLLIVPPDKQQPSYMSQPPHYPDRGQRSPEVIRPRHTQNCGDDPALLDLTYLRRCGWTPEAGRPFSGRSASRAPSSISDCVISVTVILESVRRFAPKPGWDFRTGSKPEAPQTADSTHPPADPPLLFPPPAQTQLLAVSHCGPSQALRSL